MHLGRRSWQIVVALGAAVLIGRMVSNAYRFRVDRSTLRIPSLRAPLRVAFLCDFHFGLYVRAGSVAAWVDAALAEAPDLVVIGGDLVDGLFDRGLAPLLRELARLHAPLGVYATWGNHDYMRFDDLVPFGEALAGVGVTVLHNAGVRVRPDVYLAGLDDASLGEPDVTAALRERPAGAACLLAAHDPASMTDVPPDVDLTLCGHTHGGQVRLPCVGHLIKSSRFTQRFLRGWTRQPALGYVSRGLGVGIVPFRLNCPPELTVLDLLPSDPSL